MAFDGIVVHAISKELDEILKDGRIDKIHQPEKDTITIGVRTRAGAYRLLLCANPSFPRVHLMSNSMENPKNPPMFCMLMRKHIGSGKITKICQEDFERIIRIHIETYDEMGYLTEKVLICELMGKHSNIILTNSDGKIIDSVYHVDLSVSSVRQILPGLIYTSPPSQGKDNPLMADKNSIKSRLVADSTPLFKRLVDAYCGISPLMAREAVFRATGYGDKSGEDATAEEIDKTAYIFNMMLDNLTGGKLSPCTVADKETGKLIDFNALCVSQYEALGNVTEYESINEAAEAFYLRKSSMQSLRQKSHDLMKFVSNSIDRCQKKLQIQEETIQKAEKRDKFKIYGDLITANIYRISPGDKNLCCENFYSQGEEITIPLKEELSASQNAQLYYKKYTKEKTAAEETRKQKELNLREIDYLESVKESIELAESSEEINLVRSELVEGGYLKSRGGKNFRQKKSLPKPMHFVSDDGYDIYVGKNNVQNDYVTLKLSRSTDIWMHTKSIHGSHVIVRTADAMTVPDRTYLQAASLAAYYSKGRLSKQVPVDYTEVKNVKKPSGAKPGMVIYVNYNTMYADPDEALAKRLLK